MVQDGVHNAKTRGQGGNAKIEDDTARFNMVDSSAGRKKIPLINGDDGDPNEPGCKHGNYISASRLMKQPRSKSSL